MVMFEKIIKVEVSENDCYKVEVKSYVKKIMMKTMKMISTKQMNFWMMIFMPMKKKVGRTVHLSVPKMMWK